MKPTSFFLTAACALCCQVAFAQTTTPNMQSSSATSTGTQTSSPTTNGMDNGSSVTPPAQTQRRMNEDMNSASTDRSMRKSRKTKGTMSDGKGKMKTKM